MDKESAWYDVPVKLTLPIGVTDNRRLIYSPRARRMVASTEYRDWKTAAILLIQRQLPRGWKSLQASFEAQKAYTVRIYLKDKRTDQMNYDKLLRDALTQAGVWEDDRWWYGVFTPCEIDKTNPRIEVEI